MRTRLFLYNISFLLIVIFHAQQKISFSIQEAVDYALSHNPQVMVTQSDARISQLKTQEYTGIGLPQISAGLSAQHFVKLPVSILPNFVAPAVYGGLVSAGVAPYDPQKLSPEGYAPIEAQFGQKNQASASFTASQLVFSSDYLIGLQASKSYEQLTKLTHEQQKMQTRYDVMKAYYEHQLNTRRLELLDAQLIRINKMFEDLNAIYKQGLAEKLDLDRLELARDQLQTEKNKLSALLQVSLCRLKFLMGYPLKDSIILADTLPDFQSPTANENPGAEKRYDYQILQRASHLNNLNKKRHAYGHLPSLVAFASGGYQAFNQEFNFWDKNVKWFPNFVIGGALQWNLFDGLQKLKRYQQSKLELEKINHQTFLVQQAAQLEQNSSRTIWANAFQTIPLKKRNYDLAKEMLEVAEKKYKNGVGSTLEILQSISTLKEARIQYLEALYECKMAELDYKKSTGTL
ncbi:MAG: TolC family protein [Bacteroidia bacterium]|nr:TolC family protein [Bacteroidia bacterium]